MYLYGLQTNLKKANIGMLIFDKHKQHAWAATLKFDFNCQLFNIGVVKGKFAYVACLAHIKLKHPLEAGAFPSWH